MGSRHLQAIASLPGISAIDVVDPSPEALKIGQERLAQVAGRSPDSEVRWLTTVEEASSDGDLCILATRAEGRCQLIKDVALKLGYSNFLLEKLVSQSVREMEDLVEFANAHQISGWVNFKTRAYPVHQQLKKLMKPGEPFTFSAAGGNWGLATNGIHLVDTFAFYDGSPVINDAGGHIDPVLHPSKRGNGLFDLSGTLHGYTATGSHMNISYLADSDTAETITITTKNFSSVIDHSQRWAFHSDAESGWAWRQLPFPDEILVSQMTNLFASDILLSGRCDLPTLEESLVSHRFILNGLQPTFSKLLGRDSESCPVT